MTEPIRINRATTRKPKPKDVDLGFGQIFTDHMFLADFQEEKGWYDPRVEPYGPLSLDPATAVLHYAQAIFDGLKAFRGVDGKIRLFRPQKHVERMNKSAQRLCIPPLDADMALQSLVRLVDVDRDWVPSTVGTSLYIRPTVIASEPFLGVRPAKSYIYFVILSPVGAYYPEGMAPVKILVVDKYVRAVDGGLGGAKTSGNYAASLYASDEAKHEGFTQVLWLDGVHRKYLDEVGTMNIMVKIGDPAADRDHPARGDARFDPGPAAQVGAQGERAAGLDRRGGGGPRARQARGGVGHRHRGGHLPGGRARLQGQEDGDQRRQDRAADPAALRRHRGDPVRAGSRSGRLDADDLRRAA